MVEKQKQVCKVDTIIIKVSTINRSADRMIKLDYFNSFYIKYSLLLPRISIPNNLLTIVTMLCQHCFKVRLQHICGVFFLISFLLHCSHTA